MTTPVSACQHSEHFHRRSYPCCLEWLTLIHVAYNGLKSKRESSYTCVVLRRGCERRLFGSHQLALAGKEQNVQRSSGTGQWCPTDKGVQQVKRKVITRSDCPWECPFSTGDPQFASDDWPPIFSNYPGTSIQFFDYRPLNNYTAVSGWIGWLDVSRYTIVAADGKLSGRGELPSRKRFAQINATFDHFYYSWFMKG